MRLELIDFLAGLVLGFILGFFAAGLLVIHREKDDGEV